MKAVAVRGASLLVRGPDSVIKFCYPETQSCNLVTPQNNVTLLEALKLR